MHAALEILHRFTLTSLFVLTVFVQFTYGANKVINNYSKMLFYNNIYNIPSFSFVALFYSLMDSGLAHMHVFMVATLFIPTMKFVQVTYDQKNIFTVITVKFAFICYMIYS